MRLRTILLVCLFMCHEACKIDSGQMSSESDEVNQNGTYIYIGQEKLLLRGVNIAHTSKRSVIPWVKKEDIRRLRKFGFNFIRLLIFWSAVEPERGKYNPEYLERIRDIVRMAEELEIYVLLDLHQDLYGFKATHANEGSGIPEWARDPECPPFKDLEPWMINYIDESVSCQFEAFWNDKNGVQSKYLEMFEFVVERLHEEKAIIGFEIINEPWPGYNWGNTEEWENEKLRDFYNRAIKAARRHTKKLIFYETHPMSAFGYPFHLRKPEGHNLVYAPHIYPLSAFFGNQSSADVITLFRLHLEHSDSNQVPMLIGEYGTSWSEPTAYEKIKKQIDLFDSHFIGSAIWSYDKSSSHDFGVIDDYGNPLTNLLPVIKPYPERVKGEIKTIRYSEQSGELFVEVQGEYFILRCPEILSCKIGTEKINQERVKITKGSVRVSWEFPPDR